MPRRRRKEAQRADAENPAARALAEGMAAVGSHPMFAPLWARSHIVKGESSLCPDDGWAVVSADGTIHLNSRRRATAEEWSHVLAHCLLHLGFEHFQDRPDRRAWNAACDCIVAQFLTDLRLGRPPAEIRPPLPPPSRDVEQLYRRFVEQGIPAAFAALGTGGSGHDMIPSAAPHRAWWGRPVSWADTLRRGIEEAVEQSVRVAAGEQLRLGQHENTRSAARRARSWLISSYPLLGALADSLELIEDINICRRLDITIAAVDPAAREVYINPAAGLSEEEARFVLAHELLHVGLRHDIRRRGRDPFLWNVACDYVINGWLIEMGIGEVPAFGLLHDPELRGLSAEAVYDRIAADMRRMRKLGTLRGAGACDILEPRAPEWWATEGVRLDEFYRGCLSRGLVYHEQAGRGLLPGGLVEEIRAIQQPPIAWDVELARWFDSCFQPVERRRTYARPSRRQGATPDIPRPSWHTPEEAQSGRTFGVVIDTSGSMDRRMLGMALGAIASYAASRDVPAARVVFCDVVAHDAGYMPPESIDGGVKVRGRGGTVLQPGISLLERAADFPKNGPILIITDGYCDRLRVSREHAYLLPEGRSLPFPPRGPVFYMQRQE